MFHDLIKERNQISFYEPERELNNFFRELPIPCNISLPLFLRERRVNFCESLETVYRVKFNATQLL